jgi:hypothetical protein
MTIDRSKSLMLWSDLNPTLNCQYCEVKGSQGMGSASFVILKICGFNADDHLLPKSTFSVSLLS